jgi:lysine 2,3-aminomutase
MKWKDLTNLHQIEEYFSLTEKERQYLSKPSSQNLPVRLNSYWASLCNDQPMDPLRLQAIPRSYENIHKDYESSDPLDDKEYSPVRRAVHRYTDRLLLLVTHQCALYCRHCFRRHFTGGPNEEISMEELDDALLYIQDHPEIHELILSGGDSLLLSLSKWKYIEQWSRNLNRPLIIRCGTRLPITAPYKLQKELLEVMQRCKNLWMVIQVNHPRELSPQSKQCIQEIRSRGINILNQSVLLKNINDDPEILKQLSYALLEQGIKPYYIFQGDLASGTSHFRVNLSRTYTIMKELRVLVSGMAMPQFAVDLPGGGKIPLMEDRIVEQDNRHFIFKNLQGNDYPYPLEEEIHE